MSRKWLIIVAAVAVVAALAAAIGLGWFGTEPAVGLRASVEIIDLEFIPVTLTVAVGTTVTWFNNDTVVHTVTSDDGRFPSSDDLMNGAIYSVTFNEAGEYSYHCSIHPSMVGLIVVQ